MSVKRSCQSLAALLLFLSAADHASAYYAPHLGRWVSRDPIGYRGDGNLYAYVGAKPTRHVDPLGLAPPIFGDLWDPCLISPWSPDCHDPPPPMLPIPIVPDPFPDVGPVYPPLPPFVHEPGNCKEYPCVMCPPGHSCYTLNHPPYRPSDPPTFDLACEALALAAPGLKAGPKLPKPKTPLKGPIRR